MSEEEISEESVAKGSPGAVWCPGCVQSVPVDDLHMTFTPQAAQLRPDGTLDWGNLGDVFMDYDHLVCGTHVRLVSNAGWQEEIGEYVADVRNAFLEVTVKGEYQVPDTDMGHELGISAFSGAVAEDTETWGATYVTLLETYERAVEAHNKRGDES